MRPEISVIMYVKNGMPYFKRALQSVMDQTLRNLEILIIESGSQDGTREYIQQCQKRDSRIRCLLCAKASVGAQFNLGLEKARGDYIGIVESDDYILPEMYEDELACAREYGCDVLRADNFIFFGDGDKTTCLRTKVSHRVSNYNRVICAAQEPENVLIGGSFWTGLYRREFLVEKKIRMNETPGAAYQDFGFLFLTGVLADRVYMMPKAFYCYRRDNPSSSCNSPSRLDMPIKEYQFLEKELIRREIWEQYKEYYFLWKVRNERWFYSNLDERGKKKYVHLLYTDLKDIAQDSSVSILFHNKERDFLNAVDSGEEKLYEYLQGKEKDWLESAEKIEKAAERVYLFGAGNVGRILCFYLRNYMRESEMQRTRFLAYVDNAPELWGTEIDGVPVVPPWEAMLDKEAFFIVCSENYAGEIYTQLRDAGVEEQYIAVCEDMDSSIRMLMRK